MNSSECLVYIRYYLTCTAVEFDLLVAEGKLLTVL